jgi:hypothetical protein
LEIEKCPAPAWLKQKSPDKARKRTQKHPLELKRISAGFYNFIFIFLPDLLVNPNQPFQQPACKPRP